MTRDFLVEQTPTRGEAPTTGTAFACWTSTSTADLLTSAEEYEAAVAGGRFAHDPQVGADLLVIAANLRTEVARRENEHWHGSVRHSHAGLEGHDHG
jgi:hypothetical protein